jgi:hypothetical protein
MVDFFGSFIELAVPTILCHDRSILRYFPASTGNHQKSDEKQDRSGRESRAQEGGIVKVWGKPESPAGLYLCGVREKDTPQKRRATDYSMNDRKHAIPRNEQVIHVFDSEPSSLSNTACVGCLYSGKQVTGKNSDAKEDVWQ